MSDAFQVIFNTTAATAVIAGAYSASIAPSLFFSATTLSVAGFSLYLASCAKESYQKQLKKYDEATFYKRENIQSKKNLKCFVDQHLMSQLNLSDLLEYTPTFAKIVSFGSFALTGRLIAAGGAETYAAASTLFGLASVYFAHKINKMKENALREDKYL